MSNETDFNKVAQTVAQNVQQISNNGNVVIVVAIGLLIWNCFLHDSQPNAAHGQSTGHHPGQWKSSKPAVSCFRKE